MSAPLYPAPEMQQCGYYAGFPPHINPHVLYLVLQVPRAAKDKREESTVRFGGVFPAHLQPRALGLHMLVTCMCTNFLMSRFGHKAERHGIYVS